MVPENKKIKIKKNSARIFFYCHLLLAICYLLSGCATVSQKGQLTTYSIAGVSYTALIPLCNSRSINWEYDTFIRTVTLNKDGHKINLAVGERLLLVDDRPSRLKYPVDIYEGTIVVPSKFKEQVLDAVFGETRPSAKSKTSLASLKIKTIVIDAGHGGTDPGATGKSGLREKAVTLDIAKRLSSLLKAGGFNIIMTRSNDSFIPLPRRVGVANNSKADLFISIHANANRVRSLRGFEVYYISPHANDYRRALAASENTVLNLSNASYASAPSVDLKAILWDMIYSDNRAESVGLANSICRMVNSNLNTRVLGVKGANFYVLKGTSMPAVLVEIGFLSNSNEERMIKNSSYRQQVAEAVAQGIEDYTQGYALMEAHRQ